MFGTIKNGIMELLDDRLRAFQANIAVEQLEAHRELKACGALEFFGKEDPIASSCHEGSKVGYGSCRQGDQFRDWIATGISQTLQEELPIIIGHVRHDCTLEVKLCHHCHQPGLLGQVAHDCRLGWLRPHHLRSFRK